MSDTVAHRDAREHERAATSLERCRRQGSTILLVSHEEPLLRRLCDEIWWLHEGKLMGRGDPALMLDNYREHVAKKFRESGDGASASLSTHFRRGDGRAEIVQIETLGANWQPT